MTATVPKWDEALPSNRKPVDPTNHFLSAWSPKDYTGQFTLKTGHLEALPLNRGESSILP